MQTYKVLQDGKQVIATKVINSPLANPLNPRQHWLQSLVNTHANGVAKDFATRVGINLTSVYLFLNGERPISDKTVVKVSNALGVKPPPDVMEYASESKETEEKGDRTKAALDRILEAQKEQAVLLRTMNELMMLMVERMKKA